MHANMLSCALALALAGGVHAQTVDLSWPGQLPKPLNPITDNFLGISIELSSFNTLWGNTPNQTDGPQANFLSNIIQRMVNPLRIRVGGDSMDSSTYFPNQTQEIILPDANAYYNDVPVNLGPVFFDVCNAMADKAGEMAFIYGLSMQDPENDTDVIQLAAAAVQKMGSRLDSMLLGNEPDLYAGHGTRQGYSIQDYIPEVQLVINQLENSPYGNLIPKTIVGGPSVCCDWDLSTILQAGLNQFPYKYYTIQHYPQNVCSGSTKQSSNITYYLTHANMAAFLTFDIDGVNMGFAQGVPVFLTEYNTASCGGDPAVAPTFASTLWAVDVALSSATVNFSAVFLHTREPGITYNLFTAKDPNDPSVTGWTTGSPYYTELVIAEALHNRSSVVVDLNLDNGIFDQKATVSGYALYHPDPAGNFTSTKPAKLVLINFANVSGDARPFALAANESSVIEVRYLIAPTVNEHTNISWAGQTVGPNGELEGNQTTVRINCSAGCEIPVPGPGVAVVLFNPDDPNTDQFFVGNSTVVGTIDTTDPNSAFSDRLSSWSFVSTFLALALGLCFELL